MAVVYKCKMCGGDLDIQTGETVCECEYCGAKQTVSSVDDEIIVNLFNRANNLRIKSEFDKAQEIYEKIITKKPNEPEAYWGIVLCKYGIEYVEDHSTFNRVPTCHRTQIESVLTDVDYISAIENADDYQTAIYVKEAKNIDKLQKNILSIVEKEEPFDVFICYKESDENGKRTVDSVIANDIYYQLIQEGFKVFYSAITLEDKLGKEYEPYIFSALNSAKVMLVVGTKPEYFNAVWVKNEWNRYLKIVKNDRSKLLIPCYRDMDAYDLPDEFSHLQAQNMSKIGFINDVTRGIRKILNSENNVVVNNIQSADNVQNIAPLLERVFMFLEDGDWNSADEYCERVLDQEPKNAQAYLGKLLAEVRVNKKESLSQCCNVFSNNQNYLKIMRFADDDLKKEIESYADIVNDYVRQEEDRKIRERKEEKNQQDYVYAMNLMKSAKKAGDFERAAKLFKNLSDYKDALLQAKICREKAEWMKNDFGKVIITFYNRIKEDDFVLKIDENKIHTGCVSTGVVIEHKLSTGSHNITTSAGCYNSEPLNFIVERNKSTNIKIKSTISKYKMKII